MNRFYITIKENLKNKYSFEIELSNSETNNKKCCIGTKNEIYDLINCFDLINSFPLPVDSELFIKFIKIDRNSPYTQKEKNFINDINLISAKKHIVSFNY